jgi:hypothetical protein
LGSPHRLGVHLLIPRRRPDPDFSSNFSPFTFAFDWAKPVPAESGFASRNGTKAAPSKSGNDEAISFPLGDHHDRGDGRGGAARWHSL